MQIDETNPATDFITALDADFRVTHFNEACAQYLAHFDRSMQVGVPLGDIVGEVWFQMKPLYERALGGETFQFETTYCNHNGEEIWHQYTYAPIRNTEGEVIGCISVVRETNGEHRNAQANAQAPSSKFRGADHDSFGVR